MKDQDKRNPSRKYNGEQTMKSKILNFVEDQGTAGATFTQIQRFIVEMDGGDYDRMDEVNIGRRYNFITREYEGGKSAKRRTNRGMYCSAFYRPESRKTYLFQDTGYGRLVQDRPRGPYYTVR